MKSFKTERGPAQRLRTSLRNAALTCALHAAVVTNANASECVTWDLCVAFERASAVFVGRVESIVEPRYVELAVLEHFKGSRAPLITIEEPDRGVGHRIPHFTIGETYLVFAYKRPGSGTLVAGGECSYTQRLATANKALGYARRIARLPPDTPGRLNGVVMRDEWPGYGRHSYTRLPGIHVTLQDGRRQYRAVTNFRGEFSIRNIVPGTYMARAEPPSNHEAEAPRPVRVWYPEGCGRLTLTLRFDGRVSGRLVFADGRPAAGRPVALAPERFVKMLIHRYWDEAWKYSWTDAQGRFELRTVPAGKHLLRLDTVPGDLRGFLFYRGRTSPTSAPEEATAIELGDGHRTKLPDIVVPEEPSLVVITGVVKSDDGTPVQGAETRLTERTHVVGPTVRTGPDGRFTFAAIKGRQYTLTGKYSTRGIADDEASISEGRVSFTAAAGVHLELIMRGNNP